MIDDNNPPDSEVFRDPVHILPMGGGYDWRDFTGHGPYFLCLNGLPLRDSSQYNTGGWRLGALDALREGALTKFAQYVADLEKSNATLRELTEMALEAVGDKDKAIAELKAKIQDMLDHEARTHGHGGMVFR